MKNDQEIVWCGRCCSAFVWVCSWICRGRAWATTFRKRSAFLLVAFGSSEASAQVSFDNIDRKNEGRLSRHPRALGLHLPHYP